MSRLSVPLGLFMLALAGCGANVASLPTDPDALTLISIDGTVEKDPTQIGPSPGVYGYPILGSVEITDPELRRRVMSEIKEAVQKGGTQAKCFFPRHILRVKDGGSEVDIVICFQCGNYEVRESEATGGRPTRSIAKDAQPLLDKILTDAGVPLAPRLP